MKNWHALYIRPRTEKKVKQLLEGKGIETYLPLKKTLRQWSDRKKWVEVPVVSGYIFVHISSEERMLTLQTNFITGFVRYMGNDAVIPSEQIQQMKQIMGQEEFEVEAGSINYKTGEKVKIKEGPLSGLTGNLVSVKNRHKFVVHIDQVNVNIMITIPLFYIEKV